MEDVVTLISAYAEEDRRLRGLVERFPATLRDTRGPDDRLSLKETLGHLAFWDDFAVRFHEASLRDGETENLSLEDFEVRNRQVLDLLRNDPYEDVLDSYLQATRMLQDFLRARWQDLDERARENFKIPLKHRRHHRRRLQETLEVFGGAQSGSSLAERAS